MKRWQEFLAEISQGDLFPNRETVGTENEVVMIGRFAGSVKVVGPTAPSRTAARATEDQVKILTPAPLS